MPQISAVPSGYEPLVDERIIVDAQIPVVPEFALGGLVEADGSGGNRFRGGALCADA